MRHDKFLEPVVRRELIKVSLFLSRSKSRLRPSEKNSNWICWFWEYCGIFVVVETLLLWLSMRSRPISVVTMVI